jgi:hypothetical protein
MEEGTTARWEGRESDAEGSAVNAMASMALSVRLRLSLVQPPGPATAGVFLEPFGQNTLVGRGLLSTLSLGSYTVGDAW